MILKGNQRGGATNLAQHLMKDENEHVEVHEIRGFMSGSVMGALNEIYAISQGTKCSQFMYSLSLNPPLSENVPISDFEDAIERAEETLNLKGQSRVVVFHEKEGPNGIRRHAHVVWSRIKIDTMTAVQMSHDRPKLKVLARELFLEHGWKMPRGYVLSAERDPRNYSFADWQQSKRSKKHPNEITDAIKDAWAISDSSGGFFHAMQERGFTVAKGDKKGRIVAVDIHGEIYSIPSKLKIPVKDVRARLGDEQNLQSVDEAQAKIANEMLPIMARFRDELKTETQYQKEDLTNERDILVQDQRAGRAEFRMRLKERQLQENIARQARFRIGFKGIWDRIRGEHKRITQENLEEAKRSSARDMEEKNQFIQNQLGQRRMIQKRYLDFKNQTKSQRQKLQRDVEKFEQFNEKSFTTRKNDFIQKRRTQKPKPRNRGPTMER